MTKNYCMVLLIVLAGCSGIGGLSFSNLPSALDETYPIWKVNGAVVNTNGYFNILFSETHPDEIVTENWEQVLNGTGGRLLACRGQVFGAKQTGFVVGTSVEGPTFGKLTVYDRNFKLYASCDCQKVVRMKLLDMLKDGVQEIVTWEDHHYGTCTTRHVLNVYKVSADGSLRRIFEHDVVDARRNGWDISDGQPKQITNDLRYAVDLGSHHGGNRIIVTDDTGVAETFVWNGIRYAEEKLSTTGRTVPPDDGASGVQ